MNINGSLEQTGCEIHQDVLLKDLTNTKTGGTVSLMVYPHNVHELTNAIKLLRSAQHRYVVLGDMTNVAIASDNLNFVIICMNKMVDEPIWDPETKQLTVSAGIRMKDLSVWAYKHGVSDLQWMEGIPGTVGAGAFMNAGFLSGQDFSSFLINVDVLDNNLQEKTITNSDLHYGYRKSALQESGAIVLRVRFLLRAGKKWKIRLRMLQYHRRRANNQPLELPSAGTVFVPPTPYHLGAIIPKLGLVGYTIGGAQISEKSPGFIVGKSMTGEDYLQLVKYIQDQVLKREGIHIEPEVRLIGFDLQESISWPNSCEWEFSDNKKSRH